MIDVVARQELRRVLQGMWYGATDSDEAEDRIMFIRTRDTTVRFLQRSWGFPIFYRVNVRSTPRGVFSYYRKLMLVLDCGAELQPHVVRTWHVRQIMAALVLAIGCLLYFAANCPIYILLPLGGIASGYWALFGLIERRRLRHVDPYFAYPFPSLAALEKALATAPNFRIRRSLKGLRRHPARFWTKLWPPFQWLLATPAVCFFWCCASPAILVAQCFPIVERTMLVNEATIPA
ncbi:MAG: hypothetical protein QM775_02860 [Pirellulales bacterium]